MSEPLTEVRRRHVFATLVKVQDEGTAIIKSRTMVATTFEITPKEVEAIEKEGIESEWPPL